MSAILLDTHAWAWAFTNDPKLSSRALAAIEAADAVFVSPVSFYEIGQKVRLGRWPEMTHHLGRLHGLIENEGGRVAPLTATICLNAATLAWNHRDPFDRLLAATAISLGVPLMSTDVAFDALETDPRWTARIW